MADDKLTFNQWSQLNHKAGMGTGDNSGGTQWKAPTWLGTRAETITRLNAYVRLYAYLTNQAREFIRSTDPDVKLAHREYGEPEVYVSRIAAGVLGGDPWWSVDTASEPVPASPPIPKQVESANTGDPEIDNLISTAVADAWKDEAKAAIERWINRRQNAPKLVARQEWLAAWSDTVQAIAKSRLSEVNAVGLGDSVIEIGWDPDTVDPSTGLLGLPTYTVHEPDAYHPVLSDHPGDGYPTRVHLAWETVNDEGDKFVRRITYWLAPNEQPDLPLDLEIIDSAKSWRPKYAPEVDTRIRCYYSDRTWPEKTVGKSTIWDLADSGGKAAQIKLADGTIGEAVAVPMEADYIPIVHIPNTLENGHFGVSSISRVAQILDDIAKTDGEIQSAGELAGAPPVSVPGLTEPNVTLRPGMVFGSGEAAAPITALDTTGSVQVLMQLADWLRDTFGVNIQVPKGLVGKVDASEVPSGLALALTFTAFIQLIEGLRETRRHKYRLIAKFAQRAAIAGGALADDTTVYPAGLEFGSFMPSDLSNIVGMVAALINAKAISQETGLRLLKAAGLDIDDLDAELEAIRNNDTEGAKNVEHATGSVALAATWLGLEITEPEEETGQTGPAGSVGPPPDLDLG